MSLLLRDLEDSLYWNSNSCSKWSLSVPVVWITAASTLKFYSLIEVPNRRQHTISHWPKISSKPQPCSNISQQQQTLPLLLYKPALAEVGSLSKFTECKSGEQEHPWKGSRSQSNKTSKIRASCLSVEVISSNRFYHKTDEVSDDLLIASWEKLCGGIDDGRRGSECHEALWAAFNILSVYNIVNAARLETVVWEQVLDSHSVFAFFMLFWLEKMLNLCF